MVSTYKDIQYKLYLNIMYGTQGGDMVGGQIVSINSDFFKDFFEPSLNVRGSSHIVFYL